MRPAQFTATCPAGTGPAQHAQRPGRCSGAKRAGAERRLPFPRAATFTGAGRRFEHKGNYNGAEVYDDYAHHPGELHALLSTAKELGYQRVICAFQPHTYSRTKPCSTNLPKS